MCSFEAFFSSVLMKQQYVDIMEKIDALWKNTMEGKQRSVRRRSALNQGSTGQRRCTSGEVNNENIKEGEAGWCH